LAQTALKLHSYSGFFAAEFSWDSQFHIKGVSVAPATSIQSQYSQTVVMLFVVRIQISLLLRISDFADSSYIQNTNVD